jgi:hypothetical protein
MSSGKLSFGCLVLSLVFCCTPILVGQQTGATMGGTQTSTQSPRAEHGSGTTTSQRNLANCSADDCCCDTGTPKCTLKSDCPTLGGKCVADSKCVTGAQNQTKQTTENTEKGKKPQRIRTFKASVDPQGNTHYPPAIQVNPGGQITCTQATSSSPVNVPGKCVLNQTTFLAWKDTVPTPSTTIYLGCQGQDPCGCEIQVTD